jgi:hypothetical protein
MKKVLMQLIVILLANNLAYSQVKKSWENPCPTCLPGVSYGFEWPTFPPITDPNPPPPPVILKWTNDLSVIMFQIGEINQEAGKPYFTVKYNLTLNNLSGEGPLDFHLKISQRYNPPASVVLDPSVLNSPNKYHKINNLAVGVEYPQIIEDTLHVLYPLTRKDRTGKSTYLKIPVDIIAEFPSTGSSTSFRSKNRIVILTDPNLTNNKAKITVVSPIPLAYKNPNTN